MHGFVFLTWALWGSRWDNFAQMEQDILAKQLGRPSQAAVAPGAIASSQLLSQIEQGIMTKQNGRGARLATAPGSVSDRRKNHNRMFPFCKNTILRKTFLVAQLPQL